MSVLNTKVLHLKLEIKEIHFVIINNNKKYTQQI